MEIIKVHKTDNFTIVSNHHLRNEHLSLKAVGLLTYLLSLSTEYNPTVRGIASKFTDGVDSVTSGLKELQREGYVRISRVTEKGKFVGCRYDIYETPYTENPDTEDQHPDFPCPEKPYPEKPYPENRDNNISTNNKKDYNKESTINISTNNSPSSSDVSSSLRKDMDDIKCRWNSIAGLPSIVGINGKRKVALEALIHEFGTQAIIDTLEKVDASEFLKGANDRNWKADFDWFITKGNFCKVAEGKYDELKTTSNATTSGTRRACCPANSNPYSAMFSSLGL